MTALKLHYRHTHLYQPCYVSHSEIEKVAADARRELGLSGRKALNVEDLSAVERLCVNGISYDVWPDLDHPVHNDQRQLVLGSFDFAPESSTEAVSVCVSPLGPDMSRELQLSTYAHEMGHAIFDGPALVAQHQNRSLPGLKRPDSTRAFRSVTETPDKLDKASRDLPRHIYFSELRANEFMGSLLVPRDLLWEAILEEAPRHTLSISRGEETLFAESLDGNLKIMWAPATYEMDCWSLIRAVAPHFGVNPAFVEVRMMRYGIIPSESKPN